MTKLKNQKQKNQTQKNLIQKKTDPKKSTEKSKEALDQTDKKPRVRVDEQGRPILTGIGGSKPKPKPKKKDEPKLTLMLNLVQEKFLKKAIYLQTI